MRVLHLLKLLFAGDVMRTRRLYADRWRARAQEIEELRDADQQRAVAEERVRLARDVHDIVGHYLAGIALQARAGLRRVRTDPARATQALTEIDQLASDALAETRQAVAIENDEIVSIDASGVTITDADGNPVEREAEEIDWDEAMARQRAIDW